MGDKAKELKGMTFSRLTVLARDGTIGKRATWKCICECGNTTVVKGKYLLSGETTSCGCRKKEALTENKITHGMCKSPIYQIWHKMLQRCRNPNTKAYHHYGGRGITVCKRWYNFQNFYADMGDRPSGKSIDRINNNKGYSKSNCRWATISEQATNKRNTILINGKTLSQIENETGIKYSTLYSRYRRGELK